ncbi:MAG: iron-containing alcohol dehydrogenase, partial [Rhodospirillales bacterium]|nr:iron-containing alcohol dehydrogenase [Rhodospirillales bacterium]
MTARIITPRQLLIGGGAVRQLAEVLTGLGLGRPLVVTDPHLIEIGKLDIVAGILDGAGIPWDVFSEIREEPTTDIVAGALAKLEAGDYDCLIGFGGGSPIDTAKAVSILARGGGKMRDYKVPVQNDALGLPVVAVPTTAGTGAEVTRFAV